MKGYDQYTNGYDKYIKGYYKYITGYDQCINAYEKYTKDFLEKIFTAMPKKYLRLLCPLYQQELTGTLIQLLDLVHEEVIGFNDQFQDLCDTQRNLASEMGFSCPVEQSKGPGKPRFCIPEEVIRGLRDVHGVLKKVAKEVLVSYKTMNRTAKHIKISFLPRE